MAEQVSEPKDRGWENIVNFLSQVNMKTSPSLAEAENVNGKNPHNFDIQPSELKTEIISYLAPFSQQYYLETPLNERPSLKGNLMSMTKDILVYTDTADILKVWSLHNLKANVELKFHQSQILEICAYNPHKTSVPNVLAKEFKEHKINLFGSIDEQGLLLIWSVFLLECEEKIVQKTLMSTKIPEIGKEVKMKFKTPLVFLTLSDKEIMVWDLSLNHFDCLMELKPNEINETIPGPSKYLTHVFEIRVKDADFSQKNDLVYVCLDNNWINILNVERLDVIKSFEPYSGSPHDELVHILSYRNIFKSSENKEMVPNDFSLKDIFLTVSSKMDIKVWDLSQIDNKDNNFGCIGSIKPRLCEISSEEKIQEVIENFVVEFDFTRNFLFVLLRQKQENILFIYHIDKRFYIYDEEVMKNPPRFYDSLKEYKLQSKPLYQIQLINLHDEESKLYFLTEEKASLTANQINEMQREDNLNLNDKKDNYELCDSKTYFAIFCLYYDFFNFHLILSEDVYPMYLIEDLDKIEKNEAIKPTEEELKKNDDQMIIEDKKNVFPPPLPDFLLEMHQQILKTDEGQPKPEKKSDDNIKIETEDINAKISKSPQEDFLTKALKKGEPPFYPQSFIPGNPFINNAYPNNLNNLYPQAPFGHPYNNTFNHQIQMSNPSMQMPMNNNNMNNTFNNNINRGNQGIQSKKHKNPKKIKNQPPMKYQQRPELDYKIKKVDNNNENESKSEIRSPSEINQATTLNEEPKTNNTKSLDDKSLENATKSPSNLLQGNNQMELNIPNELKNPPKEKDPLPEEAGHKDFFERIHGLFEKKLDRLKEDLEKSIDKKLEGLKSNKMINEDKQTSNVEINLPKDFQMQFNKLFSEQFEKSVTPCFEKYLIKIFEQVNNTFEKGQKFFIEKVNLEQIKSQNIRESLQDALKIFMQISNSLSENLNNNIKNNSKMEVFYLEKQSQLNKMIENVNDIIRKEREVQDKIGEIEKNFQKILLQMKDVIDNNGKSGILDEDDEKKMKEKEVRKENKEKETSSNVDQNYDPMSYYNKICNIPQNMNTSNFNNQFMLPPTNYLEQRPQMQPYPPSSTPYFNNNYQNLVSSYQNQNQQPNFPFSNQLNPLNEQNKQNLNAYSMNPPPQNSNLFKFPEISNEQSKIQDMNAIVLNNLARLQVPISYPPNFNNFPQVNMDKNQQIQSNNTTNKSGNQMSNPGFNYPQQNPNSSQMQQMNPQNPNFQDSQKSMNFSSFHLGFLPFYNSNDMGMTPSMTMNNQNPNPTTGNQAGTNLNKPKQENN